MDGEGSRWAVGRIGEHWDFHDVNKCGRQGVSQRTALRVNNTAVVLERPASLSLGAGDSLACRWAPGSVLGRCGRLHTPPIGGMSGETERRHLRPQGTSLETIRSQTVSGPTQLGLVLYLGDDIADACTCLCLLLVLS